jgi:hypothetical protein
MTDYIKLALASLTSIVVPGVAYFTNLAHPMWPELGALVAIVASIAVVFIFHIKRPTPKPPITRHDAWWIGAGIVVALLFGMTYHFLLQDRLAVLPREGEPRQQVGFATWDSAWNLTEEGRKCLADFPNTQHSPRELMLRCQGFDTVFNVYQPHAVYLSALVLMILLLLATVIWSSAIGYAGNILAP